MTTLSSSTRQTPSVSFHFDIYGGVSVGAYAVAMIVCLQQGDFSALPALIVLAGVALVVCSVHTAPQAGSTARPLADSSLRRFYRTHLWRLKCLKQ